MKRRHKRHTTAELERGDATPERIAKAQGYTHTDDHRRRWLRDSPIDRAFSRGALSDKQYLAAGEYRRYWENAGFNGALASPSLERVICADPSPDRLAKTDREAIARKRYHEATDACGPLGASTLDYVVCAELPLETWGRRLGWSSKAQAIAGAMERLRASLDTLVRIWAI